MFFIFRTINAYTPHFRIAHSKGRGETLYVQVAVELALQETIDREFGNLLKIKDNYPKLVVSGERSFENTYEGVEHIYIRSFLSGAPSQSIVPYRQ